MDSKISACSVEMVGWSICSCFPGSFADAGHVYVHIRTGVIGEQVGGGGSETVDPK